MSRTIKPLRLQRMKNKYVIFYTVAGVADQMRLRPNVCEHGKLDVAPEEHMSPETRESRGERSKQTTF